MRPYQYQLVILGPEASAQSPELLARVSEGFTELGLCPEANLRGIVGGPPSALDGKGSIAGVWFGGEPDAGNDPAHVATMESLLRMGVIDLVILLNKHLRCRR